MGNSSSADESSRNQRNSETADETKLGKPKGGSEETLRRIINGKENESEILRRTIDEQALLHELQLKNVEFKIRQQLDRLDSLTKQQEVNEKHRTEMQAMKESLQQKENKINQLQIKISDFELLLEKEKRKTQELTLKLDGVLKQTSSSPQTERLLPNIEVEELKDIKLQICGIMDKLVQAHFNEETSRKSFPKKSIAKKIGDKQEAD